VDAVGTAIQVKELALAGSQPVRITVNTPSAAAVPLACVSIDRMGSMSPLIGDFHFNVPPSDRLPAHAQALPSTDQPGKRYKGNKRCTIGQMIEAAMRWDKSPHRRQSAVFDQELLAVMMDENNLRSTPLGCPAVVM
jgi:(E)-4-hydroxy-3-methylbut-2-enyl-diphosphate synthase